MRTSLIQKHIYLALTIALFSTTLSAGEIPEYIKKLPVHTRGVLYVRNFQEWQISKTGIQMLAAMNPLLAEKLPLIGNELMLVLLETGRGDNVEILFGIPGKGIASNWKAICELTPPPLKLPAGKPEGVVEEGYAKRKRTLGFLRQGGGWVWFSNSEAVATAAGAGTLANGNNLSKSRLFRHATRDCDFGADVFLYLDLESGIMPLLNHNTAGSFAWGKRFFQGLNLGAFHAIALSFSKDGGKGSISLDGSKSGLTRFPFGRNCISHLTSRVPESASFVRIPLGSGIDIMTLCRTVGGAIDPEIAMEMNTELTLFEKENGVNIEQDMLAELTNEAVFYTWTGGKRGALLCGIRNRAAFKENLNKLFGLWKIMPVEEKADTGTIYIKSGLAFGLASDFFCIGAVTDVRNLLKAGAPYTKRQWNTKASAVFASVDTSTAIMTNIPPRGRLALAMLLPLIPKRISLTTTRSATRIELKTDIEATNQTILPVPTAAVGAVSNMRLKAQKTASASNIRQILIGLIIYRNQNKAWPISLEELQKKGVLKADKFYTCPITEKPYTYIASGKKMAEIKRPEEIICIHSSPLPDGTVIAGYVDGHTQVMSKAALATALEEQRKENAR